MDTAKIVDFLRSAGTVERFGIEGTGSYGAGITRLLSAEGFHVAEVARPNRRSRRLRGKSDPLDAKQAALNILSDSDTAVPKSAGGNVEVLRMLLAERRSASKAHAQVMNQIHAQLVTVPDTVRGDYRHPGSTVLVGVLARSRPRAGKGTEYAARQVLKRLAVRHVALAAGIGVTEQEMTRVLLAANPALFSLSGVGTSHGGNPDGRRGRQPGKTVQQIPVRGPDQCCPDPCLVRPALPLPSFPRWEPAGQQCPASDRPIAHAPP